MLLLPLTLPRYPKSEIVLAPMVPARFLKKYASGLRPGAHFSGTSVFIVFGARWIFMPGSLREAPRGLSGAPGAPEGANIWCTL